MEPDVNFSELEETVAVKNLRDLSDQLVLPVVFTDNEAIECACQFKNLTVTVTHTNTVTACLTFTLGRGE